MCQRNSEEQGDFLKGTREQGDFSRKHGNKVIFSREQGNTYPPKRPSIKCREENKTMKRHSSIDN